MTTRSSIASHRKAYHSASTLLATDQGRHRQNHEAMCHSPGPDVCFDADYVQGLPLIPHSVLCSVLHICSQSSIFWLQSVRLSQVCQLVCPQLHEGPPLTTHHAHQVFVVNAPGALAQAQVHQHTPVRSQSEHDGPHMHARTPLGSAPLLCRGACTLHNLSRPHGAEIWIRSSRRRRPAW